MPEERENVETTLEQSTTSDASQQKKTWRAIDWIAGSTLIAEVLLSIIWAIVWACGCRFEHQLQVYLALFLFILTGGYLALIFCPIFRKDNDPRWFHARILSSGIVGGSYAFLLPVVMSLPEGNVNSGGAAALRQAILLATGGLIALIALGETRRKNDNDREAAENLRAHQENMLIQQKEQFEANSFKERKAERRERYTKAIEQLGDEKSSVRMGGVYTLVGLVDEWLEEESLSKNEKLKEGQVIINNLCAYIRSPFTLATRYDELEDKDSPTSDGVYKDNQQEFYKDKAEFKTEADVRLGIIKEIHDRIQGPDKNTPGTWSDFDYNFSGSTFFYPVDLTKSYYKKSVNFSGATYQGWADFGGSTYEGVADFSRSIYEKDVTFSTSEFCSTYKDTANFSSSAYQGEAIFRKCNYKKSALFKESVYGNEVTFSESIYGHKDRNIDDIRADFTNSIYIRDVDFSWSKYNFNASFNNSIYCNKVYFNYSEYYQRVNLSDSIYNQKFESCATTYNGYTNFSGSIFCSSVHFSNYFDGDSYEKMPSKFTKHPPEFFCEYCTSDPGLDELFAKYKATDDLHKDYSFASRALFGTHNNSFDVLQNEAYSIDKNSNDLPIHCDFINSTQKQYSEDAFKNINRIYTILLTAKNLGEIKEIVLILQSFIKQFHEWREEETLTKIPYDLNKIFGSVPGISED